MNCAAQCLAVGEDPKEPKCPQHHGYVEDSAGRCINDDSDCPIGQSYDIIEGRCLPGVDCPGEGKYSWAGGCETCPPGTACYVEPEPDIPDPDPLPGDGDDSDGDDSDGGGTGGDGSGSGGIPDDPDNDGVNGYCPDRRGSDGCVLYPAPGP